MAAIAKRVALITGAASGLGQAAAARIIKAGGQVAIMDLPSTGGADTAAKLGDRAIWAPADVTSEEEVRERAN